LSEISIYISAGKKKTDPTPHFPYGLNDSCVLQTGGEMETLDPPFSLTAAAAGGGIVSFPSGEREAEEGRGRFSADVPPPIHEARRRKNDTPRKRAVLFSMFLACLSFLWLSIYLIISFASDLSQNERMWRSLNVWMEAERNNSNKIRIA